MEEKKNQELKIENDSKNSKKEKKSSDWSVKKVITTVIIAILALLMIGGLYYIILLVQQGTDESNVFGYYNGEPVKYEAGSVFYNTLNTNSAYQTAAQSGDIQGIYSAWYQAYQAQVAYLAVNQLAQKAGIRNPSALVDKFIVNSGLYASEDGSKTFDEEVYKAANPVERTASYQYYTKLYPYIVALSDIQSTNSSDAEKEFVKELSKNTRSFDYYVVDYNEYPDYLAREYDISEMPHEGEEEASIEEIKAYIFSKEPDLVKPYIEESIAKAVLEDFTWAADFYGNGIVSVSNATCNIGNAGFMFNSIQNMDSEGQLASSMNADLAKELYSAEAGYITAPISTPSGAYIVVRVASTEPSDSSVGMIDAMYDFYTPSIASNAFVSSVMTSEKHEDNFMAKLLPLLFGSMQVTQ